MEMLSIDLGLTGLALAVLIAALAGVVKGVVGFAMPMIMISGLASFMAPELALAGLILPTLVTNGMQALRQGLLEAWASMKRFRVFMLIGFICLILSAQLVRVLPQQVLFLGMGIPVVGYALTQLFGWTPTKMIRSARVEAGFGAVAGFLGGLSGIWGPPTVAYLTAIDTPKQEQMRIQGAIYGLGAVALLAAHLKSGVIRAETLPLSLLLILPAAIGIWVGFKLQDRFNQAQFRTVTMWVLLVAGANLIRRGIF